MHKQRKLNLPAKRCFRKKGNGSKCDYEAERNGDKTGNGM